jgi:hypothetical protein
MFINISAPQAARAETVRLIDLLDVPVSYTAKFRVSDGHGTFLGAVWHEPGKERREVDTKVGSQMVLLRRDQDTAYFVNQSGKWCVSFGFHTAATLAGGLDGLVATRHRQGTETVDGVKAVKYDIEAHASAGQQFQGEMWVNPSGVPLKVVGVEDDGKGHRNQVELVQTDVAMGSVAPGMLDVPTGYMTLDLKGVKPEQLVPAIQSLGPLLGRHQ